MGIKVQYKSYLPGSHPMGDLNDASNSGTWPVFHKPSSSGQFHNPYSQNNIANAYFGNHTEAVKQKILEHEAIFKNQLYELHRLYRVQMELMDELKMNELHKQSVALETSISSCSASQRQDAPRWNASSSSAFPLSSSASAKPGVLGPKDFNKCPSFLTDTGPQNGMVLSSNAVRSKDCEVEILECRPSKARRKFDLELRADEYIDLEEPNSNPKRRPDILRYTTNGSCNGKMFLGGSVKIDSQWDGPRLKNGENGLAGLNKQIHIKGHNSYSSPFNAVGCDSNFRSNQQFCSIPALPLEFMHHGRDHNRSRNLTVTPTDNGNMWPHMLDSARSKGQATAISQNLISEKLNLFNKGRDAPYLGTGQLKADYWNERSEGGPKHSRNGIDFFNCISNNNESSKSFSTLTPWENSGSCMAQKSARAEMHPCFNSAATLPQSLHSSSKSGWTPGQGWKNNLDGGKGSCSGSGPARFPPSGSGYLNCGPFLPNGSMNLKGLNSADACSSKGIDLNIASIDHDSVDRPYRGHVADLPWLKSGVGLKNGEIQSLKSSVARQVIEPGLSVYDSEAKPGANHIFGVPIFKDSQALKGARSCCSSPEELEGNQRVRGFDMNLPWESEEKSAETHVLSRRNHIDLNMCLTDSDAVMTDSTSLEKTNIKGFDLEAPGETEEDIIGLNQQRPEHLDKDLVTVAAAEAILKVSSWRKLTMTETPAQNATPVALRWFVDVISSNVDDADKVVQEAITEEADSMDYFEYMTLQLQETKEDDYLPEYPKPLELEEQTEAGPCTTRTRKGLSRRCRPKRDFQRDILPGLTSLARHEVTEDLQTLGGLMRAMGHSWQSRLTRRAGPRRGRPRLNPLPPPAPASSPSPLTNNTVTVTTPTSTPSPQKKTTTTTISQELVNMEDHRSLTGWGKTTRRPRRQRCGNNASVLRIA